MPTDILSEVVEKLVRKMYEMLNQPKLKPVVKSMTGNVSDAICSPALLNDVVTIPTPAPIYHPPLWEAKGRNQA